MKIYILNYDIKHLQNPSIRNTLLKLDNSVLEQTEIYSDEGNLLINANSCVQLNYIDKDLVLFNNYYENYHLVADKSILSIIPNGQVPPNHLAIHTKKYNFKLNTQSKIQFIIILNNILRQFSPIDCYFEVPDETDLNSIFVKEEISEFLSLLN